MEKVKLSNEMEMPAVGLGTWKITDKQEMLLTIENAYQCGYRLFDTAAAYRNEMILGKAMKELQIPREEMFVQDKLWNTCYGYEESQEACKKSLRKLKLDYLDTYLIHWPATVHTSENWQQINAETWRGLEKLYKEGYVKSIGICNFKVHHLENLQQTAEILPHINQIECHPGMLQKDILQYCGQRGIQVEASSPLGNGQILFNEILVDIANRKQKTVAQICLKWGQKHNLIVIPKTTKAERLKENISLDDFDLSAEEVEKIDSMPYCGGLGINSDEVINFEEL